MNIDMSKITVRMGEDYGGFRVHFKDWSKYFSDSFIENLTNGINHLHDMYNYYDDDDCITIPIDGNSNVYLEIPADWVEHFRMDNCPKVNIAYFGDEVLTQVWYPEYEVTHFNTEREALMYLKKVAPPVAEYIIKEYYS